MISLWQDGQHASLDLELTVNQLDALVAGIVTPELQAELAEQLQSARAAELQGQ